MTKLKVVCEELCVTKLCERVVRKVACEELCVTKSCGKNCVKELCVKELCVKELWVMRRRRTDGRRRECTTEAKNPT